jgi:hypothetical protein
LHYFQHRKIKTALDKTALGECVTVLLHSLIAVTINVNKTQCYDFTVEIIIHLDQSIGGTELPSVGVGAQRRGSSAVQGRDIKLRALFPVPHLIG